jgi:hypothetical protein
MAAPPDAFAAAFLDACAVQKSVSRNRPPEIIGVFRHFWTAIVQKCALSRNAETRSSRREAERQDTFELHRPQDLRRSAPDAGTDPRSASRHRLPGRPEAFAHIAFRRRRLCRHPGRELLRHWHHRRAQAEKMSLDQVDGALATHDSFGHTVARVASADPSMLIRASSCAPSSEPSG